MTQVILSLINYVDNRDPAGIRGMRIELNLYDLPSQSPYHFKSSYEKSLDKHKLRDILHTYVDNTFSTLPIIRNMKSSSNGHRPEEMEETR